MFKKLILSAALAGAMGASGAAAQEVTLRVHHFLPAQAPVPSQFIEPWAQKVMDESDGRIAVEVYPAMSLGGGPPSLFDQARDGIVDIIWTLTGYTPGRFLRAHAGEGGRGRQQRKQGGGAQQTLAGDH